MSVVKGTYKQQLDRPTCTQQVPGMREADACLMHISVYKERIRVFHCDVIRVLSFASTRAYIEPKNKISKQRRTSLYRQTLVKELSIGTYIQKHLLSKTNQLFQTSRTPQHTALFLGNHLFGSRRGSVAQLVHDILTADP